MWAVHLAIKEFVKTHAFLDGRYVVYRPDETYEGNLICDYNIRGFELPNEFAGPVEPIIHLEFVLNGEMSADKEDAVSFKWLSLDYLVRLRMFLEQNQLLTEEGYVGTDQTFEEQTDFVTTGHFKVRGKYTYQQQRVTLDDIREIL